MFKTFYLVVALFCLTLNLQAAYVPMTEPKQEPETANVNTSNYSSSKKASWFQKWQMRMLEKRMQKLQRRPIFPEREELTEGFQALPFFGTLFTLGLLYGVLLFTAKDSNVLRWSGWAFWIWWAIFLVVGVIAMVGGY